MKNFPYSKIDITKDKHYLVIKNAVRYYDDGTTLKPPYSDSTLYTYITNYKKFSQIIHNFELSMQSENPIQPLLDAPNHYDWVNIENIRKFKGISDNTKKNYLNAAIIIFKALDKDADDLIKYRDELMNVKVKNDSIYTEKQEKNLVEKEEVLKMIQTIKKEITFKSDLYKTAKSTIQDNNLYQLYVILKIYELLPIRNEISNVLIIKSKDYKNLNEDDKLTSNFLIINKTKFFFYFQNYKTSSKYGLRIIEVPNSLKLIIQKWIKIKNSFSDLDNLFLQREGKPLNNNNLTKILTKASQKYMGKNVSTVLLRKIFYSDKYSEMKAELISDANTAGHSVSTALDSYVS